MGVSENAPLPTVVFSGPEPRGQKGELRADSNIPLMKSWNATDSKTSKTKMFLKNGSHRYINAKTISKIAIVS